MALWELLLEVVPNSRRAIGSYVVSMTHSVSDMLEPLALAEMVRSGKE